MTTPPDHADAPWTVLVADDHAFTLKGMQHALDSDDRFEVVATAPNGIEAIKLARQLHPAVALIDFSMPGANGLEVLIEIKRWAPETRVAIVTASDDPTTISALAKAEASGILSKSEDTDAILGAMLQIVRGDRVYTERFKDLLLQSDAVSLSARETEVLIRISRGMSNPAIAADLSISPKTVESHRASLMRKLGVNSTATLLMGAAKAGLIQL